MGRCVSGETSRSGALAEELYALPALPHVFQRRGVDIPLFQGTLGRAIDDQLAEPRQPFSSVVKLLCNARCARTRCDSRVQLEEKFSQAVGVNPSAQLQARQPHHARKLVQHDVAAVRDIELAVRQTGLEPLSQPCVLS